MIRARVATVLLPVVAVVVLVLAACSSTQPAAHPTSPRPSPVTRSSTAAVHAPATASSTATQPSVAPSRPAGSTAKPVLTRGGMWWGVDSYSPITAQSLANVRSWYVGGHRPQFWGRYLSGRAAVDRTELAFARAHQIYVYLIVPDDNCSGCAGGDACFNDMTSAQARADADDAVRSARRLGVPRGAVLFKDIEQVSSCRHEPSPAYLYTWYRVVAATEYRVGFYGNVHRQSFDFPVAFCGTVQAHPDFLGGVTLDMNEDEPQIGAPRQTIGPANAPAWNPNSPHCAEPASTVIWQYGESLDDANLTDVDQARPGTHGMLAPDGGVS